MTLWTICNQGMQSGSLKSTDSGEIGNLALGLSGLPGSAEHAKLDR